MKSTDALSFGSILAQILEKKGLYQADLAEAAKTSQPVVSSLINGKRKCGLKLALRLADALKLQGPERETFLSDARMPQWKGFDHAVYGHEATLYHFLSEELKMAGVESKEIASITQTAKQKGIQGTMVTFILKDGSVHRMTIDIKKVTPINEDNLTVTG